jgi:hypothetical protein
MFSIALARMYLPEGWDENKVAPPNDGPASHA